MAHMFRHHHPTCPHCKLDWKEGEEFKIVDRECIFRKHAFLPSKTEKILLYDMLISNGFKPEFSYIDNNHFIILLKEH